MLKHVHLKNLALIREADIDFEKGLNILTGETGAGKSIIIGSITIALGDKASKSFIRTGSDYGLVELVFSSSNEKVFHTMEDLGIPREEDQIIISRRITADGSTSRINGTSVTLANLKAVTSLLVDIHGQHDHQSLLNPSQHLRIVDEAGGEALEQILREFRSCYQEYKALRGRYQKFSQNPEELAKEISFIEYEIKEIEEAALKPDEDTLLQAEHKKLAAAEKISGGLSRIRSSLFDNADSASGRISDAIRELHFLESFDPGLKSLSDYLMDLESISRDMDHELSSYLEDNTFQAERYQAVQDRLDVISRLKGKYGRTLQDISEYHDSLCAKLSQLKDYEANREELQKQMDTVKARVNRLAVQLSDCRRQAASDLEQRIVRNLKDLNFLEADFRIHFEKADKIYENGFDKVEFLISANPGEPPRPLARIASGGELSRIMLAIKSSSAQADSIGTLIFDEIDTGISGRTARKVAEKLALLSHDHQLICITHLPQIAAMADTHFSIEKSVSEGSTISGIRKLRRPDSILELARLLSGSEITEITLQSAEEMKTPAASFLEP